MLPGRELVLHPVRQVQQSAYGATECGLVIKEKP
jgi:hypothetical protein